MEQTGVNKSQSSAFSYEGFDCIKASMSWLYWIGHTVQQVATGSLRYSASDSNRRSKSINNRCFQRVHEITNFEMQLQITY